MGGKAILFLVLGFNLIFLVISSNIFNFSVRAVDNAMLYFHNSNAHSIALAGANIAASKIFFDNTWDEGYDNIEFNGGHYSVKVEEIDAFRNILKITSVGTFGKGGSQREHSVEIKLQPSSFSKFGYFSNNEKINSSTIWWTSKDTVWGPFHTNDKISIDGNPVFQGKTTSYRGLVETGSSNPEFNGGYSQSAEELPLPDDGVDLIGDAAMDDGLYFDGQDTVCIEFKNDSLTYKYGANEPETTVHLPTASPNGTIFANGATVRLKGTVDGKYTIGASEATVTSTSGYWKWNRKARKYIWKKYKTTASIGGDIYLDDDVVYKDNPLEGASNDILGIAAENKIIITDNAANSNDINIHASMYSQTMGLGAENYNTRTISGAINLLGGIIQESRMAVGTFSGSSMDHGFTKRYLYDDRLMVTSPPAFPGTGNFEVVSWFE